MSPRLTRALADRLGEPLHLNLIGALVSLFGGFRTKVDFDLISRRPYAFGVLDGVDHALKFARPNCFYALEFGVAGGNGLRSLMRICDQVSRLCGIKIEAMGFDSGAGLPPPKDYRDHPELWGKGDYPPAEPMDNVIYGEIESTAKSQLAKLDGQLCFVSIDVDYYSSATSCLAALESLPVDVLPPYLYIYFDDIMQRPNNPFAGELLAISEFNARNEQRKIAPVQGLRQKRIMQRVHWPDQMYLMHVFDHPARNAQATAKS